MDGFAFASQLCSAVTGGGLAERVRAEQAALVGGATAVDAPRPAAAPARAKADVPPVPPPTPPDLEPHVLRHVPLAQIYPYLNLEMLYGKHLGLRGLVSRLLEAGGPKGRGLHGVGEALKAEAARDDLIRADGVYRWFRARADGERVRLASPDSAEVARFTFPRQRDGERLCLADYLREDVDDYVALCVVTCGRGVRERAQADKDAGAYLRSHALQALAIESAAAFAEMLHARLRPLCGFPDPSDATIADRVQAR